MSVQQIYSLTEKACSHPRAGACIDLSYFKTSTSIIDCLISSRSSRGGELRIPSGHYIRLHSVIY